MSLFNLTTPIRITDDNTLNNIGTFRDFIDNTTIIDKDKVLMLFRYYRTLIYNFLMDFKYKEHFMVLRSKNIIDDVMSSHYNISIDQYIIQNPNNISDIVNISDHVSIEALDIEQLNVLYWGDYIDVILTNNNIKSIYINDIITQLIELKKRKNEVISYLNNNNIQWNDDNYFIMPYIDIINKYWNKIPFILNFNDYDFYNISSLEIINYIASYFFGYVDEVSIRMTRLDWNDKFDIINTYTNDIFGSPLVSYSLELIPLDIITTSEFTIEYIESIIYNISFFFQYTYTNPQVWGFEFLTGYLGNEGEPEYINSEIFDLLNLELQSTPFNYNYWSRHTRNKNNNSIYINIKH